MFLFSVANRGAISSDPSDRSPSYLLNIHTYLVNFLVGTPLQRENGNGEYEHPLHSKGEQRSCAQRCSSIQKHFQWSGVGDGGPPFLMSLATLDLSLEYQQKPGWHVRIESGLCCLSNLVLMLKSSED